MEPSAGHHLSAFLKRFVPTLLALTLVVMLTSTTSVYGLTVDTITAKSNDTSTGNVLGGVPTRVTWESLVDEGDTVKDLVVQLPSGASFSDESTVRVTVLDGTTRLSLEPQVTIDTKNANVKVVFAEPIESGKRIRVEMYKTCLPNVEGKVTITAEYTDAQGFEHDATTNPNGNVEITVSSVSPARQLSNWLDEQEWVQAWNSVTFLNLFVQPQLIVSSIPTVAMGWLISLLLVAIGFPLAIPIGLLAAFMKISRKRILMVLASIYTGVVRGTPLFLQIYIAFFGLPMMGINLNQYLLAILVLGFNSGAYLCEIFRAGIQSIPKGQFEASRSLGMNAAQTMFFVIIPQTVRRVIPTMTSEFILLYKDTSLLAAVGVMELMLYSKSLVANTGNMTPYIVAACFYLLVTLPLIKVVGVLEERLSDEGNAPKKRKNRRGAVKQMKEELQEAAAMEEPILATTAEAVGNEPASMEKGGRNE